MMTIWQFTAYWLSLASDPMVKWFLIAVLAYSFGWWWRGFSVSSFVCKHLGEIKMTYKDPDKQREANNE